MRDTKQGTSARSKLSNSSQTAYLATPMQETFADSTSSQDDDISAEDSPRENSGSNSAGMWDSKGNSQEDLEDQHSGRQRYDNYFMEQT